MNTGCREPSNGSYKSNELLKLLLEEKEEKGKDQDFGKVIDFSHIIDTRPLN